VENNRLGAALSVIQASQLERDMVRLSSKKLTLREKDRIEAARITAGTLEPEPPAADGLSEVASFLERFEAEQKARTKAHNVRTALRRKALTQGQRPGDSMSPTGHFYCAGDRPFLLGFDILPTRNWKADSPGPRVAVPSTGAQRPSCPT